MINQQIFQATTSQTASDTYNMRGSNKNTDVFTIIKRRRSIGKMQQQRPARQQIERMLEAASYAPNYHNTEPWRFFVITDQARNELEEELASSLAEQLPETGSEKAQAQLSKARNKVLRAPVIIVVVSVHTQQPGVLDIENVEATAAAVQNMLLVAEEMGLACIWRTGSGAYDPRIKRWLGIREEDHIVALIDVGLPAIERPARPRKSFEDKTTWIGWDE